MARRRPAAGHDRGVLKYLADRATSPEAVAHHHHSGVTVEESPFGIEWMRFEADSPLPELVRTVPHVAFEVEDLEAALEGHEVLIAPNPPSEGIRVAPAAAERPMSPDASFPGRMG